MNISKSGILSTFAGFSVFVYFGHSLSSYIGCAALLCIFVPGSG